MKEMNPKTVDIIGKVVFWLGAAAVTYLGKKKLTSKVSKK